MSTATEVAYGKKKETGSDDGGDEWRRGMSSIVRRVVVTWSSVEEAHDNGWHEDGVRSLSAR